MVCVEEEKGGGGGGGGEGRGREERGGGLLMTSSIVFPLVQEHSKWGLEEEESNNCPLPLYRLNHIRHALICLYMKTVAMGQWSVIICNIIHVHYDQTT